jgi:hypothetical protein
MIKTISPTLYNDNDRYVVRCGEIAVEIHEYTQDGDPLPPRFARFRAMRRAECYAAQMRGPLCRVKAWRKISDDQSTRVDI